MHRTGFLGDEAPSMIVLTMIHRLIIPFIVGGSLEECTRRGSEAMAWLLKEKDALGSPQLRFMWVLLAFSSSSWRRRRANDRPKR